MSTGLRSKSDSKPSRALRRGLWKIFPEGIYLSYHWLLAWAAAVRYGFPSNKLVVIGVTGTNGKSTVTNLIARVLEASGGKVGLASTVNFKVGEREWLNKTKMTMLGRSQLQKLLAEMVAAGCRYAVVETSSEGIKQYRHAAINYDLAVFTNLTPEHLESHGGFENYRKAKGKLFRHLGRCKVKPNLGPDGGPQPKIGLINLNDPHAGFFLGFRGYQKWGWKISSPTEVPEGRPPETMAQPTVNPSSVSAPQPAPGSGDLPSGTGTLATENAERLIIAENIKLSANGSDFSIAGVPFHLNIIGQFNVENATAAVAVGLALGLSLEQAAAALAKVETVPGRMERIDEGQPFGVIVDYAPEPESFRKLYQAVSLFTGVNRIIHVLGSCGGGRDRARRPVLGRLAAENADTVIVTDEDPYDDDPMEIINEVAEGAKEAGMQDGVNLFRIQDRTEAIRKAVSLAQPGDLVIITGKGSEQAICRANGKKEPWDDRTAVREALQTRTV